MPTKNKCEFCTIYFTSTELCSVIDDDNLGRVNRISLNSLLLIAMKRWSPTLLSSFMFTLPPEVRSL